MLAGRTEGVVGNSYSRGAVAAGRPQNQCRVYLGCPGLWNRLKIELWFRKTQARGLQSQEEIRIRIQTQRSLEEGARNENLRLYWQIARFKLQIGLGRLKQDLNRDPEEVELIHCGCREDCALCQGEAHAHQHARSTSNLFLDRFSLLTQASRRQNGGSCKLGRQF